MVTKTKNQNSLYSSSAYQKKKKKLKKNQMYQRTNKSIRRNVEHFNMEYSQTVRSNNNHVDKCRVFMCIFTPIRKTAEKRGKSVRCQNLSRKRKG